MLDAIRPRVERRTGGRAPVAARSPSRHGRRADRAATVLRRLVLQDVAGRPWRVAPLPRHVDGVTPTTGYDDVQAGRAGAVCLVRRRRTSRWTGSCYGPKLAQVALTFGADDMDDVSALDEVAEGRRRAPLEEIRRNIAAAGLRADRARRPLLDRLALMARRARRRRLLSERPAAGRRPRARAGSLRGSVRSAEPLRVAAARGRRSISD